MSLCTSWRQVTPAPFLNFATKWMCHTAGGLPTEQHARMGLTDGMDVLVDDNHPNPDDTRPPTVQTVAPS
jgi:hypothetical protein